MIEMLRLSLVYSYAKSSGFHEYRRCGPQLITVLRGHLQGVYHFVSFSLRP